MYVVLDRVRKLKSSCKNKDGVDATIITFCSLFGSKIEDIRVVTNEKELTYEDFCRCCHT